MRILSLILLAAYCSLPLLAEDTPDSQDTQGSTAQNPQDTGQQTGPTHPAATTYSNDRAIPG